MKQLLKLIIPFVLFISVGAKAQIANDTAALNTQIKTILVANGNKQITALQLRNIMLGITSLMKSYALDSSYRVADTLWLTRRGGYTPIKVVLNTGGAPSEGDPTVNAAAKTITDADKTNWNSKQNALTPGTGITLIANVLSAQKDIALWNAIKLNGNPVSSTAPANGQVIKWNGTEWAPANDSIGAGGGGFTPPGDNTKVLVGDGTQQSATTIKSLLGLNLIDNTSDVNKPVSTAQAASIATKQATLVSGTNIKTINSTSLLGSGDIAISGSVSDGNKGDVTVASSGSAWTLNNSAVTDAKVSTGVDAAKIGGGVVSNTEYSYLDGVTSAIQTQISGKQATLVSGTSIKTINGTSLLGSGDIPITGGGTPANPTVKSGLTAINGSASTYMRSDAAPAMDTAALGLHAEQTKTGIGLSKTFKADATNPFNSGDAFGGFPTLFGHSTQGSGTAIGYLARADNKEAIAIGPQTIVASGGLATIAIGDAAKATAHTFGGRNGISTGIYGNQIVMGDAAYTNGNINFFIGGGGGITKNKVGCLFCQGSHTDYAYDFESDSSQLIIGGYDDASGYFSDGSGLYNRINFGPIFSNYPHHQSIHFTDIRPGGSNNDFNGLNDTIAASAGTGIGNAGKHVFTTADKVASGTGAQTQSAKLIIGDSLSSPLFIGGGDGIVGYHGATGSFFKTSLTGQYGPTLQSVTDTGNATTNNISIGAAASGNNALQIRRNDGSGFSNAVIGIHNTSTVLPVSNSGSDFNYSGLNIFSGNDASLSQLLDNYGSNTSFNESGLYIMKRDDNPIIFRTGATNTERGRFSNSGFTINTGSNSFTFPTGRGTNTYVLATDGSGGTSWVAPGGAGSISGLTTGRVPYANSSSTIVDDGSFTWDNTSKLLKVGGINDSAANNPGVNLIVPSYTNGFTGLGVRTDLAGRMIGSNFGYAGLNLNGFSNGANLYGIATTGYVASASPTVPSLLFNGFKSDGSTGRAPFGSSESVFQIWNGSPGTDTKILEGLGSGKINFAQYGAGTFTGTVTKLLGVTSSGDVVETISSSTGGGTPTVVVNSAAGSGGAASIDAGGKDGWFKLQIGIGTSPTSGNLATVTLSAGYPTQIIPVFSAGNTLTATDIGKVYVATSTNTITFVATSALTTSGAYVYFVHVNGY